MRAILENVAGVDVHKEMLALTVLRAKSDGSTECIQFESKTFTEDLVACGAKLLELGVKHVAMESTGVYWKPIHNVWSPMGIELTVAQAAHVKQVPGRKTDMNDSHWLAELHRFGLIRPSFIPDEIFQRLRLLSRHRTNLVEDLARVKNRIQKTLEDGNVKFGVIASDVFGKSGLQILREIAKGQTNPEILAKQVTTKIQRKDEAKKALTNCLTKQHVYLIRQLLEQYDHIDKQITSVDNELFDLSKPYHSLVDDLKKIPGISDVLAMSILAEATNQMDHFENERSFAAWAGVAPGNNESAGKKKDLGLAKEIPI